MPRRRRPALHEAYPEAELQLRLLEPGQAAAGRLRVPAPGMVRGQGRQTVDLVFIWQPLWDFGKLSIGLLELTSIALSVRVPITSLTRVLRTIPIHPIATVHSPSPPLHLAAAPQFHALSPTVISTILAPEMDLPRDGDPQARDACQPRAHGCLGQLCTTPHCRRQVVALCAPFRCSPCRRNQFRVPTCQTWSLQDPRETSYRGGLETRPLPRQAPRRTNSSFSGVQQ
ncbi:hypothetical protein GGR56DRAFT_120480 [Xylariaceae sp. FL0804]|nr:hypothetical protein GGR56DRAFT_120480 [Xylariaceae sp. FL0804]